LKTQGDVTRLLARKVRLSAYIRTFLIKRRVNLKRIKQDLSVKRKIIGALRDKFKVKSASLPKSVRPSLALMKRRRIWKAK